MNSQTMHKRAVARREYYEHLNFLVNTLLICKNLFLLLQAN